MNYFMHTGVGRISESRNDKGSLVQKLNSPREIRPLNFTPRTWLASYAVSSHAAGKGFGAAALSTKMLCMSAQDSRRNPRILNLRDSELGIQSMNHAGTLGSSMKSLICSIFPWSEKAGQFMPWAITRMRIFWCFQGPSTSLRFSE